MKRFTAAVAISSVVLSSARLAGQSAPPAEKTAGEAYKNVQVLKDIPASDLPNSMWFIAGSLGVPCQHCHAGPNESDAKPAKLTARKMLQMTRDLNAASFGGRPIVTCNTCHQGSVKPNGVPGFWGKENKTPEQVAAYAKERQSGAPQAQPFASAPPSAMASPNADALPSAESIYEKYRKAVGTTPVTSVHLIAKGDPDVGPPNTVDLYVVLPDRIEQTVSNSAMTARAIANGDRGWTVRPEGTVAMPPDQLQAFKANALITAGPLKFTENADGRTTTGIETIGGRSYYVVEWQAPNSRFRQYFDTQTGLLYKTHGDALTPLGTYPFETVFSGFREVNGLKFPAAWAILGTSGGIRLTASEIEVNVPVDPKRFDPPAVK